MREFFKPWRRKLGLLTLMMACVAMAAWIRSEAIEDNLVLGGSWSHDLSYPHLDSYRGGLNWYLSSAQLDQEGWHSVPLGPDVSGDPLRRYTNPHEIKWRWLWFGFDAGKMNFGEAIVSWCRIPYWSIVLPLTALSAFLLLTKPRLSTQERTTESASVEGATS